MPAFEIDYASLPDAYVPALKCVMEHLEKASCDTVVRRLFFQPGAPEELQVSITEKEILIGAGSLNAFLRGVGCAAAGVEVKERIPFSTLGVLLDCSRNRVYKPEFLKKLLTQIALAGYNQLMLYTEDVYELPEEPAFGYMRGRYSAAEIREVGQYASRLGIELCACIQTLGHMEHLFTHHQYADIRDTGGILLADEEKTYALLEKMIHFWSKVLPSGKLHIGMDETHDLGRGKHLDRYGFEPPSAIYLRHLKRVCGICDKYGVKPAIWSDMLLRFAEPEKVRHSLPANLELYYWNYSGVSPENYEQAIAQHQAIGRIPAMASAVYSYNTFCWFAEKTEAVVPACVKACEKTGIKNLLFTVWGDAGAFFNFDSVLAGLCFAASTAYGEDPNRSALTPALFHTLCSEDYHLFRSAAALHRLYDKFAVPVPGLFWQDPLQGGIYSFCFSKYPEIMADYRKDLQKVRNELSSAELSESLQEIYLVIDMLLFQLSFREKLLSAYSAKNHGELKNLAEKEIPAGIEKMKNFDDEFRTGWMKSAKPFGLEIIQRRNAGVIIRLEETARRLEEYLAGTSSCIEELEEALHAAELPGFYPAPPVFSSCLEIY